MQKLKSVTDDGQTHTQNNVYFNRIMINVQKFIANKHKRNPCYYQKAKVTLTTGKNGTKTRIIKNMQRNH